MASRPATGSTWIALLFLLMAVALLSEIASRRLRGTA
jgi:hypothetical protein